MRDSNTGPALNWCNDASGRGSSQLLPLVRSRILLFLELGQWDGLSPRPRLGSYQNVSTLNILVDGLEIVLRCVGP
jgi:hypothetical protein